MEIITHAPGKLFIAGEYAVTNHAPAIISAVPKYLRVNLKSCANGLITSDKYTTVLHFKRTLNNVIQFESSYFFNIVQRSIHITEQFLREHGKSTATFFHMHISSELDDTHTGKKYGLGSSGALTVATIQALLHFYQHDISPILVYKLACLVHLSLNSNGSFGDLAISAFGGLIVYQLFDKNWVLTKWKRSSISELVTLNWPNLKIEPLTYPKSIQFLVGWTGSPASTEQLVADIKQSKKDLYYQQFIQASYECVLRLQEAFQTENFEQISDCIRYNRQLIKQLSPHIETPLLTKLCQIAEYYECASKVSGAGGGDCGICLLNPTHTNLIKQAWQTHGIETLFILGGSHAETIIT